MEKELQKLINEKNYKEIASIISDMKLSDATQTLATLNDTDIILVCRELDSDFLADILLEVDSNLKSKIIDGLRDKELEEVMDEVTVDETMDIIESLPNETAVRLAEKNVICAMIKEKNFTTLKPLLANMNEMDLATIFEELDDEELPIVFRLLPKDLAADTFVEMEKEVQEKLINKLNDIELKAVMEELFIDDMVDIVEEMPANVVKRLLTQSDAETRAYINEILKYPKDSAGSIMTVEFVSLSPTMTVLDAFKKIKNTAIDKETIYTCYVTDKKRKLIGVVTAKELMLADHNAKIQDIMEESVIYGYTLDDKEEVSRKIQNYGLIAIPIVDEEKRLVGIVTVDDAMDVLVEENTEDIAKMAATSPNAKPYLKTSVFTIWKNRIPWLLVLMISATFTGLILNTYEEKLNAISSVLFACVPMIMDTGGNAGSQASVTVIRSLALNELKTKDIFKVIWKEFRASLLLGSTLAVACFAKLMIVDNLLFNFSGYTPIRCAVVSLALMFTVVLAKLVGCVLPLIAKMCHLDPAVVASPFITTIVDAVSLILYCMLSIAILS